MKIEFENLQEFEDLVRFILNPMICPEDYRNYIKKDLIKAVELCDKVNGAAKKP